MAGVYIVKPVCPDGEGTRGGVGGGGCSRSGLQPAPREREVVVEEWPSNFQGPNLATGFGFCTGIQNQLAVLTGLAEGKMRLDLSLTYGREQRGSALHKHTCILFVERTLYDQFVIAHLTDQPVTLFGAHLLVKAPVMKARI